jgi:DNA polymerase-3 subunit epsilon
MSITLKRPLAIFDLETTGLNITQDRIVEIGIIKANPDGTEERYIKRVNPEMPIPNETSLIHGIYDADVINEPTFAQLAEEIVAFIGDADLAGYNSNKFDIPVLSEELLRVGNNFDVSNRNFVDVQNIFHKMEQRTLAAAYLFYCDKKIENAHNALADTEATWEVLKSQVSKYETLENNVEFLSDFSKAGNYNLLDFAGRLALNEEGDAVYNFGKNKGKTVREIAVSEPGYYGWMLNADFPLYTKQCLRKEMDKIKNDPSVVKSTSEPVEKVRKRLREEPIQLTVEEKGDSQSITEKLEALKNKFK